MGLYSETVISIHFEKLKVFFSAYKGLLSVRVSLFKKLDSGLLTLIKSTPDFSGIPDVMQSQTVVVANGLHLITSPQYGQQNPTAFWNQEVPINQSGSFRLLLPGYPGLWDPELTLKVELLFKPDHVVIFQ